MKILDPEEDLTIRPYFPGRGPFGRLTEALDSKRAVTRNPVYRTPVSRKNTHGGSALNATIKKEPPISEVNIPVGARYIAPDLSDEDFSSPKSRKHKLNATKTPNRSQLSITSSIEARPEKRIGGSNRNAQNLSKHTQTVTADTVLSTKEPFWPEKHKRSLAIAAKKALFEDRFNAIRRIFETEILTFLDETCSYEDLCKRFESKRFRVDRVLLAQRLLAAVPDMQHLTCFTRGNPESVAVDIEGTWSIDQQGVDQDLRARTINEIPRSTHELVSSGRTSMVAEANSVQPVPPLRAPVANMTFRSQPSHGILDEHSSNSPNVDDRHVANGNPCSAAPKHLLEDSKGIDSELISNTLFQMENMIQSQRRREQISTPVFSDGNFSSAEQSEKLKNLDAQRKGDAILKDEARGILGNSRSVFKNQSRSREYFSVSSPSQDITNPLSRSDPQIGMTADPNTNSSEDCVGLQAEPLLRSHFEEIKYNPMSTPKLGESDLFLPAFESAVVREQCSRSTPEHVAFGKWANRNGEARQVVRKGIHEGPTLLDFFTPEKRPELIARTRTRTTLEEGHFARHHKRKKALVEVAKRQKFNDGEQHSDQDGFDGQEMDIDTIADAYDRANQAHPTTGGKGISKATMSLWKADIPEEAEFDLNDAEGDEGGLGEPEVLYQYDVHMREWLTNQNESDAPVEVLGPYYTMAEANAVAAASVKKPTQENSTRIFRPGAWSYNYSKEDHGMETHAAGSR